MEMMRMKISNYKVITLLTGVCGLIFICFLSLDSLRKGSNEIFHYDSLDKIFEFNTSFSNIVLLHNSVSLYSVSTGVSYEIDDEEDF